jgi:hypothetical protein
VELTLTRELRRIDRQDYFIKEVNGVEADGLDNEKEQRKTLLSKAPFREPGQCGSVATTDISLGDPSVDTRCACREPVAEDNTTQSATD